MIRAAHLLLAVLLGLAAPLPARAAPAFRLEGFPPGAEAGLRAEAAAAYARARQWFGVELRGPVTIRWVRDAAEIRRLGVSSPGAVAGLALPESRLVALYAPALAARPGRVRPVLLHEICHLFFAEATARAELLPPRWLNEGIAMWISGDWDLGMDWRSGQDALLRDAMAAGGVLPFAELDVTFPDGPFFHVAYAQSLSFVEWMVRQGGETSLQRLLRLLDEDLDPEPAFAQVYGTSLPEAEEAWRDEIGGPGLLRRIPSAGTLITFLWIALALLVVARFVRTRIQLRRAPDDDDPAGTGGSG
jgi:hypothetical protein